MTMLMEEGDDLEKADEAEGTNGLEQAQEADIDRERDDIISFLTSNEDICFKNQQRWEADLTTHEKFEIALKIFRENKLNFLMKFGKYLKHEQLGYFEQFKENVEPDSAEIKVVLCELYENVSINASGSKIKNRRYEALKQMVQEDSYFSELEMMKRNPLLYEQLIGQYLTSEEIKERDRYKMDEQVTFVKILMEGIERDNAEICRKEQEEMEDGQMEEEEEEESSSEDGRSSSPVPSTSRWGEFEKHMVHRPKPKTKPHPITEPERKILKEEFITSMYQSFLDGNDLDFNYESIDNDTSYDNIDEMNNDAEEKYFDSEDLEVNVDEHIDNESSEDELDMYMNALNQHPAVSQLSSDMKRL